MQEGDFPPPGRPAPEDEGVSHAGGHGSDPGISGDGFRSVCIGAALNRQTVRTLEKNVARDGALTAVRLLAQDIMEGNRPGEEMEPEKTELEVIPEDGLGTFTVPVTVWAGEEGRNLVLYGMCAYGGQTEAVSLLLEKTEGSSGGVTPSSAAAPVWRPVRYAPAEPLEE